MKRMKQVLALLLSLALLLGLCGLAEEPVAEIAEPIEELIEETPAEEAEAPVEEELPEEEAPAEEPEEAPVEEGPVEESGEESIELEPVNADSDYTIEGDVFVKCNNRSITECVVPDGIKVIGTEAFAYIESLQKVTLPDGLIRIENGAFTYCHGLTDINIPSTVTEIGSSAFSGVAFSEVQLPAGLTELSNSVLQGCSNLTEVVIPEGVTRIGDSALRECPALTSVKIPSTVKEIGKVAFEKDTSLQTIVFPNSVTEMGDDMLTNCTSLENVTLPANYSGLLRYTFRGCASLKSISIPKGVDSLEFTFWECPALETVVCAADGATLQLNWTFKECPNLKAVYVPKKCWVYNQASQPPFPNSPDVTVYGYSWSGSLESFQIDIETYCKSNGIKFEKRTSSSEPPVDATVTLPFESKTLSQKETATLKPKTTGLKKSEKYEFSTSDANIAAVSKTSGKITAKNPGTATITAKGKTSKQSASCTVTVLPAPDTLTITGAPESGKLNLGAEPLQLAATIAPAEASQDVTWSSSKPKIASVEKATGLVKALKEGKTTITATAKHKNLKGKSVTAKFTLTVVDPKRPTAIKIDPEMQTELVMTDGQQVQMQLKHVLEPAETAESGVTWSIPKKAHKSYASVTKEGLLTAKKAGKVQLKVTAAKKNAAGKTLSATVDITITDPTIPTSVTIIGADGAPITQNVQIKKGEKLTLQTICAPETAANAVLEWSSSNKKIAKVDKSTGEITAVKTGKAKITAKAKKGGQKMTITVEVIK